MKKDEQANVLLSLKKLISVVYRERLSGLFYRNSRRKK